VPYYISDTTSCPSWAVVKEDGEVLAFSPTKEKGEERGGGGGGGGG